MFLLFNIAYLKHNVMKKHIFKQSINKALLFLFLTFAALQLQAQSNYEEVVYLKNGSIVRGTIIEQIPGQTIKIQTKDKSVFVYKFEEIEKIGKSELTEERSSKDKNASNSNDGDFFVKGQADASRYYKGYRGAGSGTLISSLLIPIVGLIPAIACSSTSPQDANLNYPNSELMKKTDYYNGYTQKAAKIKKSKVWTNFGIGFGVNLAIILILTAGSGD